MYDDCSNPQALNALSMDKVVVFVKVRYQGLNDTIHKKNSQPSVECMEAHWLGTHKTNQSLDLRYS